MAVLSLQSSVSYGHVGNSAAAFCMRRVGLDVWPVDTVAFSNHPGHGRVGGGVRPAAEIADIVAGLDALGIFGECRAVISGYLGDADTGPVVLDAVSRVKAAQPDAVYCCDPVMGDQGPGLYVSDHIVRFFRDAAVPAADILVPNHFELEVLASQSLQRFADVQAAAERLLDRGPRLIVVTSLATSDVPADRIETVAFGRAGAWRVTTPRLHLKAHGTGDAFAAVLLSHLLRGVPVASALESAVSSIYAVVEATVARDADELCLTAAQDMIPAPSNTFVAEPVS